MGRGRDKDAKRPMGLADKWTDTELWTMTHGEATEGQRQADK